MAIKGRGQAVANTNKELLESKERTATNNVWAENTYNLGGAFIIDVTEAGVRQVETATVVATITISGNIDVTITSAGMSGSPKKIFVAVASGDDEDAVATKIREALNADAVVAAKFVASGATDKVILTSVLAGANDATLNIDIDYTACVGPVDDTTSANTAAGEFVKQVETATSAGTISTSGNLEMIVTSLLVAGSPLTIPVAVLDTDDTSAVAVKIRAALDITAITDHYTVSGATTAIILTAKVEFANDASLNIDIQNDTSAGYTDAATSADTTAGALTIQVETATLVGAVTTSGLLTIITTGTLIAGSPLTQYLQVTASDTVNDVAAAIRSLMDVAAITDNYAVGGTLAEVILTANTEAANDATLNIDYHITTDIGLTAAASSANTTAGGATIDVTPKIEAYDTVSGKYYDILTGLAITAVGTTILKVHPLLTASANVIAKDMLPKNYRVTMTHGDALVTVYSVAINGNN